MISRRAYINNYMNSTHLEDARDFEASLHNKPIFSRDLIRKVAGYIEQVHEGHQSDTEKRIQLPHVLGNGSLTLTIPRRPPKVVTVNWLNTYLLIEEEGKHPEYFIGTIKNIYDRFEGSVTLRPDDPNHPLRQEVARMPEPPELKEMDRFETIFLKSKFWAGLREHLDTQTVPVKNIVCIGLGTLFLDEGTSPESRITNRGEMDYYAASQHILACSCANYLSRRYADSSSSPPSPIPIVARDPAYEIKDMHVLSRLSPPITIVSDPYQYLAITPNTLVIAIGFPVYVPVYEIAADVCFPSGPAAIICAEIFEHTGHKDGLMAYLDPRAPRVSKMLAKYDTQWLGKELEDPDDQESEYEEAINDSAEDLFLYARKE
jgi:hypothetical protein